MFGRNTRISIQLGSVRSEVHMNIFPYKGRRNLVSLDFDCVHLHAFCDDVVKQVVNKCGRAQSNWEYVCFPNAFFAILYTSLLLMFTGSTKKTSPCQ
jgi:hypothetical protein